jgi:hypothetical protein
MTGFPGVLHAMDLPGPLLSRAQLAGYVVAPNGSVTAT